MTFAGGTAAPPTFVTATVWGFPWDTGRGARSTRPELEERLAGIEALIDP